MGEASQSGYDDLIRFVSENMNQKLVGCDPFDVGEIMKRLDAPRPGRRPSDRFECR